MLIVDYMVVLKAKDNQALHAKRFHIFIKSKRKQLRVEIL